jgi:hypothetical protein
MNFRAAPRIIPLETGLTSRLWVGLPEGTICEPTDLTHHPSTRKGSAPR